MKNSRRIALMFTLTSTGLILLAAAVLVLMVPSIKQSARAEWHAFTCPAVPESRTQLKEDVSGITSYADPIPFGTAENSGSPNLHFDFDLDLSMAVYQTVDAFDGPKAFNMIGSSPAIVRVVGDVSDSLRSVSVGFWMKSTDPSPGVRIVIRIERPDGALVEWNEKRLLDPEHRTSEWERFNFEWLLRELPVDSNDRVIVFISSKSSEPILIDEMDIVFRSVKPFNQGVPHA